MIQKYEYIDERGIIHKFNPDRICCNLMQYIENCSELHNISGITLLKDLEYSKYHGTMHFNNPKSSDYQNLVYFQIYKEELYYLFDKDKESYVRGKSILNHKNTKKVYLG